MATIIGGTGNDNLVGTADADYMDGLEGNDTIAGLQGGDTILGGIGSDLVGAEAYGFYVSRGDVLILSNETRGGVAGRPAGFWSGSADNNFTVAGGIETDYYHGFETTYLTDFADTVSLTGDIYGLGGDDSLTYAGYDSDGVATIDGGAGNDTIVANIAPALVELYGGEGDDLITWVSGYSPTSYGGAGNDTITGTGGPGNMFGGDGNDSLTKLFVAPGTSYETLDGGAGSDTMAGAESNTTYYVDDPGDVVIELSDQGTDVVYASITYKLPTDVENLILTGTANIKGTGNDHANTITGNAGTNRISGGAGGDVLAGMDGADTVIGGAGNDTILGGIGADLLEGGRDADLFRYGSAAEGGDTITGYKATEDSIQVSAAGFGGGLLEGMDVVASGRYVANNSGLANSAAGVGQFVFEKDVKLLWWDIDGAGGEAAVLVADLTDSRKFSGAEISVIA